MRLYSSLQRVFPRNRRPVIEWIHSPMYTIKRLLEFDRQLNSIKAYDVGRANRTMKKQTTSKKIKAAELPVFDVADYLDSQEAIAEYLTAMIESGDASMVAVAMDDVARAKGMADVAKASPNSDFPAKTE